MKQEKWFSEKVQKYMNLLGWGFELEENGL